MQVAKQIIVPVSFVFIMGLVMIFDTSSAEVIEQALDTGTKTALIRQGLYGLLSILSCFVLSYIQPSNLVLYAPRMLWVVVGLLCLVFVPGVGVKVNGAMRWLHIAGMSIQPSELVKVVLPLALVGCFYKEGFCKKSLLKSALFIFFPLFLIALEPNNATIVVIIGGLFSLFFLVGLPLRYWAIPVFSILLIGSFFAYNIPYVASRVEGYLYPEKDLLGKGHQAYQAKVATGSGGLFGKGPGKSIEKLSYLPEAQNDYIAAIFSEEFGFIGIFLLIGVYTWLLYIGFSIAFFAKDKISSSIAAVSISLIAIQVFLNLAVVSGLLPSTGINLPFFSQGGSSLIANGMLLGILMSVSRYTGRQYE